MRLCISTTYVHSSSALSSLVFLTLPPRRLQIFSWYQEGSEILSKTPIKRFLLFLVTLNCITGYNQSRRRRRRRCLSVNCRVSSWSSWSVCSSVLCGKSGFEQRLRYIVRHPQCGGTACPPGLQETRICYGTNAFACVYSTWATWSSCPPFQCGDTQTSSRYIVAREWCGGPPCNMMALTTARPCKQTFCVNQRTLSDGKCYCKSGFHGSCWQYSSKYICIINVISAKSWFPTRWVMGSNIFGNSKLEKKLVQRVCWILGVIYDITFWFRALRKCLESLQNPPILATPESREKYSKSK